MKAYLPMKWTTTMLTIVARSPHEGIVWATVPDANGLHAVISSYLFHDEGRTRPVLWEEILLAVDLRE